MPPEKIAVDIETPYELYQYVAAPIVLTDAVIEEEVMAFNEAQMAAALKKRYLEPIRREIATKESLFIAGRRGGKTTLTYAAVPNSDGSESTMEIPRIDSWQLLKTLLGYSTLPPLNVEFILGYIDSVAAREKAPEPVVLPQRHISFED